jgi:mono/diheme cytochrome c family protein
VRKWRRAWTWTLVLGLGWTLGCSDDAANDRGQAPSTQSAAASSTESAPGAQAGSSETAPAEQDTRSEQELIAAGRGVYNANCIACHNMDPAKDGALGPAVAGASYALLEARIVRGEYPPGYEPKRDTRVMIPLPHLKPQLKELTAYLDSK